MLDQEADTDDDSIDPTVAKQWESIRRAGVVNPHEFPRVQAVAYDAGYDELVMWIHYSTHSEYESTYDYFEGARQIVDEYRDANIAPFDPADVQ